MTNATVDTAVTDQTAGRVARFAIVRVAALPYSLLQALRPPRTARLVAVAAAARQTMAAKRERLENVLYRTIPLANRPERALFVTIKRDIHNGRLPRCAPETIGHIVELLPTADSADLLEWIDAVRTTIDVERDAQAMLEAEIETHLRPRLHEATLLDALRRPLVLASPALSDACRHADRLHSKPGLTKRERSLLGYLARAAAKTSPFSAFMHCALLELKGGGADPIVRLPEHERRTRAYVNRGATHALFSAAVRASWLDLPLAVNPTTSWDDESLQLLAPAYVTLARRRWRVERPSRIRLHSTIASALRSLPSTFSRRRIIETLTRAGVGETSAATLVGKLIDAGVLVGAIDVDAFTERPEDVLRDALVASGCAPAAAAVSELSRAAAEFASADVHGRLISAGAARAAFERAAAILGGTRSAGPANLILEDGYYEHPLGTGQAEIVELASAVADVLCMHIVERLEYGQMRARLIAAGGVCNDVPRFLAEMCAAPERPVVSSALLPPRGTVAVAVAAQLARDPRTGTLMAVLNHVHSGGGALYTRWAFGRDEFHVRLREHLSAWIHRTAGEREPVDVLVCGECNPLQAHPRLTERVLTGVGEPCATGTSRITLAELALAHDSSTGSIDLLHDKQKLHPVYLGATVLGPTSGPAFWLTVVGRRFELDLPSNDALPPTMDQTTCVQRPRLCVGPVVLRRATWWIATERIRAVWLRRTGAGRLVDVAADLETLVIPPVVFARAAFAGDLSLYERGGHKPIWLDTLNPFCLDLLERLLDRSRCIELTEVLPEPDQIWPNADGGPRATEVLLELMV